MRDDKYASLYDRTKGIFYKETLEKIWQCLTHLPYLNLIDLICETNGWHGLKKGQSMKCSFENKEYEIKRTR